jgi:DNA invertase Pin-like site-specific DNA recombinase
MNANAQVRVRCAIYTRKSSDEGLDQAFNSLQAQREACEAYIKSQAHEGWRPLPAHFDDGGISGGTMERPALLRLLHEVDAGRVDTIVVYKIDRLTRSLADFARIVERLEAKGASFVSVTQAFNTTTSMGRLTLNVLLSFAQFEREVTGERIRDKIAASKKKGMWMGGVLPLGYDAPADGSNRALVVNPLEAETVRRIFQAYLDLGSVSALEAHLDDAGVRSKGWRTKSGREYGGVRLGRGALYHLLQNRTYLGEMPHRNESHPGLHPSIIPLDLFDAVQGKLASQRLFRRARPTRADTMPLKGLLFDAEGERMSPSFGYGRGGKLYRYYVSSPLQRGRKDGSKELDLRRIAAPALEDLLRRELSRHLSASPNAQLEELLAPVSRIDLEADIITIQFRIAAVPKALRRVLIPDPVDGSLAELALNVCCKVRGGRTWVISPSGAPTTNLDVVLIRGLRQAHRVAAKFGWAMADGRPTALDTQAPQNAYQRRLCRLVFLAPDLQADIIAGRQPAGLSLDRLLRSEIPLSWTKQRALFAHG